jgi:hypothetical protein
MEELRQNVSKHHCVVFDPEQEFQSLEVANDFTWKREEGNVSIAVVGDDRVAMFFARHLFNSLSQE